MMLVSFYIFSSGPNEPKVEEEFEGVEFESPKSRSNKSGIG